MQLHPRCGRAAGAGSGLQRTATRPTASPPQTRGIARRFAVPQPLSAAAPVPWPPLFLLASANPSTKPAFPQPSQRARSRHALLALTPAVHEPSCCGAPANQACERLTYYAVEANLGLYLKGYLGYSTYLASQLTLAWKARGRTEPARGGTRGRSSAHCAAGLAAPAAAQRACHREHCRTWLQLGMAQQRVRNTLAPAGLRSRLFAPPACRALST